MQLVILLIVLIAIIANVRADTKVCEVCSKVIDDVRAEMGPRSAWKNKSKVEEALGKYCKRKDLGVKEKKICYYLDPIKRDVAQPFSLGMPSEKVCKRLEKVNPEVCSVKYPMKTEKMDAQDYNKLRVKQLRQILADRGVECKGCAEKKDFVKRAMETEHMAEL
mmetsp:Transcript_11563/g.23727  ORF Transcript_11563/g.23727 Transcript_11563/m.23727 type:complete len:164 (+) Transcript_11563:50-541(+)|eukprot:CAMPEP_0118654486 /NCGR_PEP_ID=MMETSP0785-20121206/12422_1 /TAXON_ID=91992 /ORGANISM="Bolidomonas pacifica, Strain CCMP 1866" /LENGTH=163 /DNA_ID=CAMNT_0006547163 /DNA_START=36 /DNA_END=527 /DNA_ORIENTATION=-